MRLLGRTLLCVLLAAPWMPAARADVVVTIRGVEGVLRRNVEDRLGLRAYARDGGKDAAQVRRLHRAAGDDIRSALEAYGYYEPRIKASLAGAGEDWQATYDIDPGPPTLLESVQIEVTGEGAQFPALREAAGKTGLRVGATLHHDQYEQAKSDLARAAYQNGFLDARFAEHLLRVDVPRGRASVRIVLDTGPRYYFGDVTVAQEGLDPAFIARYVPIRPGDPFEPDKVLQAQFVLSDLGYFSTVDVQPHREQAGPEHRVPVVIATTPRPRRRYDIGAGYATDKGAQLTLGAEFRRLNESGHKLKAKALVAQRSDGVGLDYRIPLGTRAGDNLGFTTAYATEHVDESYTRHYDFTIALARTPGKWQREVYVKHTYEWFYVPTKGEDSAKLLLPGVSLSRAELDDPIHARKGWSLFLDVHGGDEAVVSDVTFLQGHAILRGALPLGPRGRLLGRAEFGANVVKEFQDLPVTQRFYAGGDQSVRGYAYQSLGRRDATGTNVGGTYLTTYSLEAENPIWRNWGGAVFFDMGNADDDPAPRLFRGAGIGARYRAPVGTVNVDLAYPLDAEAHRLRLHLGIRVGL